MDYIYLSEIPERIKELESQAEQLRALAEEYPLGTILKQKAHDRYHRVSDYVYDCDPDPFRPTVVTIDCLRVVLEGYDEDRELLPQHFALDFMKTFLEVVPQIEAAVLLTSFSSAERRVGEDLRRQIDEVT